MVVNSQTTDATYVECAIINIKTSMNNSISVKRHRGIMDLMSANDCIITLNEAHISSNAIERKFTIAISVNVNTSLSDFIVLGFDLPFIFKLN